MIDDEDDSVYYVEITKTYSKEGELLRRISSVIPGEFEPDDMTKKYWEWLDARRQAKADIERGGGDMIKVKCKRCGADIEPWYEGSHDWVFDCGSCDYEASVYAPHIGDEDETAIDKYNNNDDVTER